MISKTSLYLNEKCKIIGKGNLNWISADKVTFLATDEKYKPNRDYNSLYVIYKEEKTEDEIKKDILEKMKECKWEYFGDLLKLSNEGEIIYAITYRS